MDTPSFSRSSTPILSEDVDFESGSWDFESGSWDVELGSCGVGGVDANDFHTVAYGLEER